MATINYADTLAGRVFSQSATPLGLAIPIYTATAIAGGMPIWNPPNSNRNVELLSVDINTASGTSVYGAIGLMALPLSAIATGALCTAFAATTPNNGFLIGGSSSRVQSSNAGTVTVTAGTAGAPSTTAPGWVRGLAQINGEGAAAGLHGSLVTKYVFDGTIIIPPGVMVYLACTLATVSLQCSTIVWREIILNAAAG